MKPNLLGRLITLRNLIWSVIVGAIALSAFPSLLLAQTAASSVPAQSTANPTHLRSSFNHLQTGFPLTGAHVSVACETCHVGGNFKGTPKECAGCHTAGRLIAATPKHLDHIQTTRSCETCHISTASFQSAVMDHTGITQPCQSCHNPSHSAITGKPSSHIITADNCEVCHKNTSSFLGAKFDHTGIQGNCANCHNGSTAPGKPTNHVPATAACEACHTNTTTFLGAAFDHTGISTGCASCHGGQYAGVKTKPTTHVPTTAACETCHNSTTTFLGATFSHDGITTGCASCHNGATALGKPTSGHITTTAACETCHSNTTTFTAWVMNHTGITTGCASCHGGQYIGVKTKSGTHVTTTASCETCHSNTTTFLSAIFNHAAATVTGVCQTCHDGIAALGKPAVHVSTGASCDTCHTNHIYTSFLMTSFNHTGVVVGAGTCSTSCHYSGAPNGGAAQPAAHMVTVLACDSCHKNTTSFLGAVMDHTGITSGCLSCHDGTILGVVTKTASHISTTAAPACETCHTSTSTFTAWTMKHTGIAAGSCASCHNNQYAGVKSKPSIHISTPILTCDTCHSGTITFAAWTMNHTGIAVGSCTSCHNNQYAGVKSKSATHIPTSPSTLTCDTCHIGTTTFLGATFVHTATTGCASCHGGQYAGVVTKPAIHIPTTAACENCHTNTTNPGGFATWTMSHTGIAAGSCASCHSSSYAGVTGKPAAHLTTSLSCDSCHTNHIYTSFLMTSFNHTGVVVGAGTCSTGCHYTGAPSGGAAKPTAHIVTSLACDACHKNTTSFLGAVMDHTGITTNCVSCHGGTIPGVVAKPATHFTTTAACENCHLSTVSFLGAGMDHTGVTTGCASCHGGQYTGVVAKPATHIATSLACESCHSPSSTSTGGFAAPNWTMSHTGITSGCASCHGGQAFQGATMVTKPVSHISTSAACETCHSNTTTFTAWTMNHTGITTSCASCHTGATVGTTVVKGKPVGTHITTNVACEVCHTSTTNPGGFTSWTMNHIGITTGCANCHGGQTFQGATMVTKPGGLSHITTSAACETCHSTTTLGGFAIWMMNHTGIMAGVAGACENCHGGQYAGVVSKPGTHITPVVSTCGSCHTSFTTFFGATYTHPTTGIAGTCANCHNGTTALGKPAGHVVTSLSCDSCHTNGNYTSFLITSFNHATSGLANAVVGNGGCATSCHNGGTNGGATKPTSHIVSPITTGPACDACHKNTTSFLGAIMSHTGITTGCASCHSGQYAGVVVKPAVHITTTLTCESCHTTTTVPGGFATWTMNHTGITTGCVSCHGGQYAGVVTKSGAHLPTTQSCELCHASKTSFLGALMNHTGITSGCQTCHNGITAQGQISGHIATAADCVTCHTVAMSANFTTWLGAVGGHTLSAAAAAGHCMNSGCHVSGGAGKMYTNPPHIPATGIQCDVCHTASYASLSFLTSVMNHAVVAGTRCDVCHNGSYTAQGTTGAQSKTFITNHIPTTITGALDCNTCHTSTAIPSGWLTEKMNHNAAQGGGTTPAGVYCVNCHLSSASYLGSMQKKSHNGASTAKDCSISGCHKPRGSKGTAYSAWN